LAQPIARRPGAVATALHVPAASTSSQTTRRPSCHHQQRCTCSASHIIMPHTLATMVQQLRQLGLQAGDTVFIHSSFNSLGRIDGGAATLLRALEDVVLAAPAASDDGGGGGGGGRLLWPSFNLLSSRELRLSSWDIQRSPSTVGWFSEYVRQQPGTFRSDHYSHSVACRGAGAQEYVSHHLERNGCRSAWDQEHTRFGRTFGDGNPMLRAYAGDGKLLMLGTLYDSSTYLHVVESLLWARMLGTLPPPLSPAAQLRISAAQLQEEGVPFPSLHRQSLGGWWEGQGQRRLGTVGDAECRLCLIRTYVDGAMEEVLRNPWPYLNGVDHGQARPYGAGAAAARRRGGIGGGGGGGDGAAAALPWPERVVVALRDVMITRQQQRQGSVARL
jgi:aminoglycoside 3-N-acetyltransferase